MESSRTDRVSTEASRKELALLERLSGEGSLIVAYSGGVDSAYLAWAAHRALGERSLAVTARSPSYPRSHLELAVAVAESCAFSHRLVETAEMHDPNYARNPSNRCYFCKSELFSVLERLREELGFESVAYGINSDDTADFRPGQRAAEEHRVLTPLLDAGLDKTEIRSLSARAGLATADLPASACLASRIPYGMEVTPEKLLQIDRAEDALRELGFRQVRVRHHGDVARIELPSAEIERAMKPELRSRIARALRAVGFRFVSVDLEGYRTGSLNEVLEITAAG